MKSQKIIYSILNILYLIALAICFYPVFRLSEIGDGPAYPCHFNLAGEPDAWCGKFVAVSIPFIALILVAVMTYVEKKLGKKSDRHGQIAVCVSKICMLFVFAHISVSSFSIAIGDADKMNNIPLYVLPACILITIVIEAIRRKKELRINN